MIRRPQALRLALVGLGMVWAAAAAAQTPPPGFEDTVVLSGLTLPTAVRFAADGRVFVAEKSGVLEVFDRLDAPTPTVFADLRANVHAFLDRGLLGLALDPGFPARPYVYVLYTYDFHPVNGRPAPNWGDPSGDSDPCPTPPGGLEDGCVVSGRLSRLEAADNGMMTGSEHVLIEGWCQQYPSHSIGSLAFGADGMLYVTGGDGASYTSTDYGQRGIPLNPCGDPPSGVGGAQTTPAAEGGALRSQSPRRDAGPVLLNGTVLRVDPETGEGVPGNPWFASADPNKRRLLAFGLRNPFRMTIRPGTNEVWLGDVGWFTWEEINRVPASPTVPLNFGWPCYEGADRQAQYEVFALSACATLYAQAGAETPPFFAYQHDRPVVPGESCGTTSGAITGLAFYGARRARLGGSYPATYGGALFFADAVRGCVWVMFAGADGVPDPARISQFVAGAPGPVDLQIGPGGDLYYVDHWGGSVHRVRRTRGGNLRRRTDDRDELRVGGAADGLPAPPLAVR